MTSSQNLVLRTLYISPDLDNRLRAEAYDQRTSKNDVIRNYLLQAIEYKKLVESLEARTLTEALNSLADSMPRSVVEKLRKLLSLNVFIDAPTFEQVAQVHETASKQLPKAAKKQASTKVYRKTLSKQAGVKKTAKKTAAKKTSVKKAASRKSTPKKAAAKNSG